MTPLLWAAHHGQAQMAELLLANRADMAARDTHFRMTPLHHTAEGLITELAELLLDAGADVNAVDEMGNAPLAYAEEFGTPEMARLLREHGGRCDGKLHGH